MKKFIVLIIFTLLFSFVYSTKIDSLEILIQKSEGIAKAEFLNQLSEAYQHSYPNKSVEYAVEAYKIAKRSDNDELHCSTLNNIATGYYFLSDYPKAQDFYSKALLLAENKGFISLQAKYLNNLGLVYKKMDNWDQSLNYFLKSLEMEQLQENQIGEAQSLCNIGNLYYELDKQEKALDYYKSCLSIYETEEDIKGLATTLNNIGIIYDEDKDYSIALDYYLKSLEYERILRNNLGVATTLNNIGLAYYNMNIYDKAVEYLKESLIETEEIGEKYGIANSCINLGNVLLEADNLDEALIYLTRGIGVAGEIKSRELISNGYGLLSKLYTEKKDYEKAFDYLKKSTDYNKDYQTVKTSSIRKVEETIYNNKKEKEIENLKFSNAIYLFLIIIVFLVSLTAIIIMIFNKYRLKETLINEMQLANNQLMEIARTDPLTSLSNRRGMVEKIEYEMYRYERNKNPFVIVMGDIDDFKEINDKFGHECGDFVLKHLSNSMISILRKQDIVGRWGGEEFLLMLPETKLDGGILIMEKIRKKIETETLYYKGNIINITITFGVIEYKGTAKINHLIDLADKALYQGKKAGKNRVNSYQ